MYKLKDIISSGGTNPKINKAIDRYELSKDEKKDIINSIKTNVPQSGGSGGGTEASSMEYLDVSGVDFGVTLCVLYSYQNKFLVQDGTMTSISSSIRGYDQTYIACSICFSDTIVTAGKETTILEDLKGMGITEEMLASIPRLTEEEFYNLEA